MFLNPFSRRGGTSHLLAVTMTGVKLGDRVAFLGAPDPGRVAAVAAKVGLSGRAVAVVADAGGVARVDSAAADAGVLVETAISPLTALQLDGGQFDLAVIDGTGAVFQGL